MKPTGGIFRIIQEGASVAALRVVLIATSFVSSVVVARALSIEERGLFGLLVAVGAFAIQFGNFGLPNANTYLVARQPQLQAALFSNTIWVLFGVAGLLALLCGVVVPAIPAWESLGGSLGVAVWLVAMAGLVQMVAQNLLAGRFLFTLSNLVDIFARVGGILGMLGLWYLGNTSAGWFSVNAAVLGLVATVWGLRVGGVRLVVTKWDAPLARQQLRYGIRAYGACLASFILSRLPLYAVESRGGLEGLAYYTQALVIADTMLVMPIALGTVLFPNLAAASDVESRIQATLRLAGITAGLMLLAVLSAIWLGPRLLPFVYGEAYAASMPLLTAMLPGIAALGVCSVMQNALSANGYPWASVLSPVIGVAATAMGLHFATTVAGCAHAYSLGGIVMLIASTIGWWLHRRDWTSIPAGPDQINK